MKNATLTAEQHLPAFHRPVIHVKQSPLNKLQWCLGLRCGHDAWVTSKSRPKRKTARCSKCAGNAAAYHGDDEPNPPLPKGFTRWNVLDYIKTPEDMDAYVRAQIELRDAEKTPDPRAVMWKQPEPADEPKPVRRLDDTISAGGAEKTDAAPELCRHDDSSWCTEECAEKVRKLKEWRAANGEVTR